MEKPILYEALRQYLTRSSTRPELLLSSVTLTVGRMARWTDVTPISHICCNIRDAAVAKNTIESLYFVL